MDKIIDTNKDVVAEYKNGKEKAFAFLVGQTIKELKGKGNPALINTILKQRLRK